MRRKRIGLITVGVVDRPVLVADFRIILGEQFQFSNSVFDSLGLVEELNDILSYCFQQRPKDTANHELARPTFPRPQI